MVDRKQLDFGVACRAGNANRSCELRTRRREGERKRKKERETERLAARRLCRCFADDRTRRGRIEWFGRKERERTRSKRAFIAGRTS